MALRKIIKFREPFAELQQILKWVYALEISTSSALGGQPEFQTSLQLRHKVVVHVDEWNIDCVRESRNARRRDFSYACKPKMPPVRWVILSPTLQKMLTIIMGHSQESFIRMANSI